MAFNKSTMGSRGRKLYSGSGRTNVSRTRTPGAIRSDSANGPGRARGANRGRSDPRYGEEGRPQKPSPAHPVGYSPKGLYDKPDPGLGMRDTAMPGFGRNPRNKWGEKTYDRYPGYANPGRKAGGAAEPLRTFRDATQRAGRGYGMLDNGNGRGFGVKNFRAGNEGGGGMATKAFGGSKRMPQTVETPTSILNTGPSRFDTISSHTGGIGTRSTAAPAGKGTTGELDSGDGTGFGGRRP